LQNPLDEEPKRVASPISTSNWGGTFEHLVAGVYLVELLLEDMPYGLREGTIEKVQFQTAWTGEFLDDVAIYTREPSMKLVLQIKHNLEFEPSDKAFIKVLKACWDTFKKQDFSPKKDWYGIGLGVYQQKIDSHLQQILNLARESLDDAEFFRKLKAFGSEEKRNFVGIFQESLKKINGIDVPNEELFRFLGSLVVLYYDIKPEGKDRTWSINYLRQVVKDGTPQEAILLFNHLAQVAAKYSASAGTLTLEKLKQEIPSGTIKTEYKVAFDPAEYKKRLREYLRFVEGFKDDRHELDKRPLNEYYVQNRAIVEDIRRWEKNNPHHSDESWRLDDFLSGGDWYMLLGAEFGIGKTSMMRMTAARLASAFLKKNEGYIPVLASFKDKLRNVYYKENLDFVFSNIVSPRQVSHKTRVLLILDGLDEYGESIEDLLLRLNSMHESYPLMKVIITTRMNAGYPRLLGVDRFIRLLPFSQDQVNSFFEKYGVSLSFNNLSDFGLRDEEKTKPLFCWMMAVISARTPTEVRVDRAWNPNARRALIYQEFIHSLLRGKYQEEARISVDDFYIKYVQEKKILRKIAALKQMAKGELTEDTLRQDLNKFGLAEWSHEIDPILTSYFTLRTDGLYKMVDFIHESFKEYLVAEYYIESLLETRHERLYIDIPSRETLAYMEGLIELLKNNSFQQELGEIAEMFLKSLSSGTPPNIVTYSSSAEMLQSLRKSALQCFVDKSIVLGELGARKLGLWSIATEESHLGKKADQYQSLWLHRWIAAFILNRLGDLTDKEEFEKMVSFTSHQIPYHLKEFKGAKLSKVNLDNADLSNSNFEDAIFYQAHLIGSSFSYANLKKTRFFGATLIGASLDNAECEESNLTYANLTGASLKGTNFKGAKLSKAILDGADLGAVLIIENGRIKFTESNRVIKLQDAILDGAKIRGNTVSNLKLQNTNLSQSDLRGSDLINLQFTNVNFFRSNLHNVRLIWCDFTGDRTDLSHANLSGSEIIESNLSGCSLRNAILTGAHLDKVNLRGCDLQGADLRGAYLGRLRTSDILVDSHTRTEGVTLHSKESFEKFDQRLKALIRKQNKKVVYEKRDKLKTVNLSSQKIHSLAAEELLLESENEDA
jgi:uncharacterized protein YjbI with pentapeptide repeats